MSVLIKGMEMPKNCAFCRFNGAYCYAKGDEDAHSTLSCPLVPIPDHGDLIDIDEQIERARRLELRTGDLITAILVTAPVVIPAERSEWQEPEINPCRGCGDYDGKGGCKSSGGCAERSEE